VLVDLLACHGPPAPRLHAWSTCGAVQCRSGRHSTAARDAGSLRTSFFSLVVKVEVFCTEAGGLVLVRRRNNPREQNQRCGNPGSSALLTLVALGFPNGRFDKVR
jgi:hypothetical protein